MIQHDKWKWPISIGLEHGAEQLRTGGLAIDDHGYLHNRLVDVCGKLHVLRIGGRHT